MLTAVGADGVPPEVRKFIDRREGCDHMRGEVPDAADKRRVRELEREVRHLCKGTDAQLAQLKRKYHSHPLVMQRLNEFEPNIEPSAAATGRGAKPRP